MEYRDLSSWRVSIPRVSTGQDGNGRKCFVFVVEVQRIDASTSANNGKHIVNSMMHQVDTLTY